MDALLQDLRYGVRALRRDAAFAALAALTLALGIGANTTIFSAVDALLLRALPFPNPDRLVWITLTANRGSDEYSATHVEFSAWAQEAAGIEGLAALRYREFNLGGRDGAVQVRAFEATASLPAVLGVSPLRGRFFLPDEEAPGQDGVVVLSEQLWRSRFGADPAVIGRTIELDGSPRMVVGVLPQAARFPPNAELWVPLALQPEERRYHNLDVIGRLAPGVSLDRARASLTAVGERAADAAGLDRSGWGVRVQTLQDYQTSYQRTLLLILLGTVAFVLLIACANVANMLLARAAGRGRELAVRAALGAGRRRIARQLLTESALLALGGGVVGTALAVGATSLLRRSIPVELASFVAGWDRMTVDGRTLVFTLVLTAVTALLFGGAPALRASRADVASALREGAGGTHGRRGTRLRRALVAGQIALALTLLVGAGLMVRSLIRLVEADPGFRADNVLTLEIVLPRHEYASGEGIPEFQQRLIERVATLPGVRAAGMVNVLPMSRSSPSVPFAIEGRAPTHSGEVLRAGWRSVTPGYLEALGIPLVRGRRPDRGDVRDAPGVILVNEAFVRRHWPDGDPLGQRLIIDEQPHEIIGVVGDVRHAGPANPPQPEIYVLQAQWPSRSAYLAILVEGDPAALTAAVRREIVALEPDAAIARERTMRRVIDEYISPERLMSSLLGVFGVVALLLAATGLYGVIAYVVSRRTREIGIRMAIGARTVDVVALVLREGIVMVLAGAAVGLALALAAARAIESILFGVASTDPLVFAGVVGLLVTAALAASLVPAVRAARLDPVRALRGE